ncbi:MAG: ROK family protein, partial [Opitutaceae bacterium]|nr:ROK family protein [Opitutaceae bacterium]
MNTLGIDIGGSALKGAPVDTKTGRLLAEQHRIETPGKLPPDGMARAVAAMVERFAWRGPVGVGFPGVVQDGVIRTAANLHKGFVGCDARKLFSKAAGVRVAVLNDADAAGLAEISFGAGRKKKGTVLLLTLGTGIGSALFVDGNLCPNTELGHLRHKGKPWERFASGSARARNGWSLREWAGRLNDYLAELRIFAYLNVFGGVGWDYSYFALQVGAWGELDLQLAYRYLIAS